MDIQKLIVVAAYLDGWRLDQRNSNRLLFIKGRYSIYIGTGGGTSAERGKWFFSGLAPLAADRRRSGFHSILGRNIDSPRVGISCTKAPRVIAAELERL